MSFSTKISLTLSYHHTSLLSSSPTSDQYMRTLPWTWPPWAAASGTPSYLKTTSPWSSTQCLKQDSLNHPELSYPPDNDWDRSWHLARLEGLGPDMTSFLWKVLHKLLPSQDRLSRILPNKTPLCQLCQDQVVEDLPHAFFQCRFNGEAGTLLLNCLSAHMPRPSPNQVLTLGFDTSPGEELPLVWFTGFFLQNIWSARIQKKQPQLFSIRADLEARASILRETRHRDAAIIIREMSDLCFNGIIQ